VSGEAAAAEVVTVEVAAGVARVQLARPEKHNALDLATFRALRAAQQRLRRDPSVRAVILSGAGPSFCSGIDLAAFAAGPTAIEALIDRPEDEVANLAQTAALGWRELPVPVIAAIHGACFGGGLQIALGADVRIAAPDARLSVMEVALGLVPDMAISQTLPRLLRADVALELSLSGRVLGGAEAAEVGLVTGVSGDAVGDAEALAAEIARRSPHAVRAVKRLLTEAWGGPAETSLRLETELMRGLLGTPNQREAVRAALAKEEPRFEDPRADG
jgi:enoyl-CoA hydratase/carnithine racemase